MSESSVLLIFRGALNCSTSGFHWALSADRVKVGLILSLFPSLLSPDKEE